MSIQAATIFDPKWEEFDQNGRDPHDWRSYVTLHVRQRWDWLDGEAKACIWDICEAQVEKED